MEKNIDTFLEFTGSTDRQQALQYLLGSDGRLEQAVNLFLSGAPPQQDAFLSFTTAAARAVASDPVTLENFTELLGTESLNMVFIHFEMNFFKTYSAFRIVRCQAYLMHTLIH